MAVPKRNQPRYPAASPRSLAIVVSLPLAVAVEKHVDALLEAGGEPEHLTDTREAAQGAHQTPQASGHFLDALSDGADAIHLAVGLPSQGSQLPEDGVGFGH